MNFEFSDEQQQLQDTVSRYLTEQYAFDKFRAINASPSDGTRPPGQAWQSLACSHSMSRWRRRFRIWAAGNLERDGGLWTQSACSSPS